MGSVTEAQEVRQRIESASELFQLKARAAQGELNEISPNWDNNWARRFERIFVQAQDQGIEAGAAALQDSDQFVRSAEKHSADASASLRLAYTCEEEHRWEAVRARGQIEDAEAIA